MSTRTLFGGLLTTVIGLVGVGVGIFGILDPIGSKMADDGDPFGTPASLPESLFMTLFFALIAGLGIWLLANTHKRSKSN